MYVQYTLMPRLGTLFRHAVAVQLYLGLPELSLSHKSGAMMKTVMQKWNHFEILCHQGSTHLSLSLICLHWESALRRRSHVSSSLPLQTIHSKMDLKCNTDYWLCCALFTQQLPLCNNKNLSMLVILLSTIAMYCAV